MSTVTPTTADQLLQMPRDGMRYELVRGELHMMSPAGGRHGLVVGQIHGLIWNFVMQHQLGIVFGAETGFILRKNPDTVRAPDVAFVATKSIPSQLPDQGYWPGPPDLAVEVLSPDDTPNYVAEKTGGWLDAGVQEVWIVDPKRETICIHSAQGVVEFAAAEKFSGSNTLPGLEFAVSNVFGMLNR